MCRLRYRPFGPLPMKDRPGVKKQMQPITTRWPAPLQRALSVSHRHSPTAAATMESTLPILMRPLLTGMDDPARWGLSLLTDGGYPFEFTFTTAGDGIRYTAEIAPPRQEPSARLGQAIRLLAELGLPALPEEAEGLWLLRQVQAGALRWGAWMGVRHSGGGKSLYKLYAEVSPEGEAAALGFLNSRLRRPVGGGQRAIQLQMVGWYPATGDLEFYFRVYDLRPWELGALLHPLGLEARERELFDLFQAAHGRPIYQALPGGAWGFSYSLPGGEEGGGSRFSFYTFAETLLGDDARARRKLLRLFERVGCAMDYYLEMSAPLADEHGCRSHHGLFGVTVGPEIPPIAHIGLRPPAGGDRHD